MRLMLDTNALVDYYSRRAPYNVWVEKLFMAQAFGDVELWASAKSFTDVFYILKRMLGSEMLQAMIGKSLSCLRVCSIDGGDVGEACTDRWPDFEDCLVYKAAQKVKADAIITRDAGGFNRSNIPALSAQELIERLEQEEGITYDLIDLNEVEQKQ